MVIHSRNFIVLGIKQPHQTSFRLGDVPADKLNQGWLNTNHQISAVLIIQFLQLDAPYRQQVLRVLRITSDPDNRPDLVHLIGLLKITRIDPLFDRSFYNRV
ncbi:hypothetical protein D3C71_1706600 [compost metagenome]